MAILQEGANLRHRFPILRHQNAIGATILGFSLLGMVGAGAAYVTGHLAWWVTIPLVAFFASLTHELEHDLIHWMYFRNTPWAHHLMMGLVWLARPSTINPWIRRKLHFNHHKFSGTEVDIEERAITNGERWSLRRLFMTGDNTLSILLRLGREPDTKHRLTMLLHSTIAFAPLGVMFWAAWYSFVAFHLVDGAASLAGHPIAWSAMISRSTEILDVIAVIYLAPNALRTFCLHFVSSNMHYYGDVEVGNVLQETQVLNPWWLIPAHLFCFNFGSTHAIHHFVVKEPFYVRQMTAPVAHRAMREMGVRFNDFGTFRRANRWRLQG